MGLITTQTGPRKWRQFIKSSVDDLGDPVFLTFDIDFFAVPTQHPFGDGMYWDSLFKNQFSDRGVGTGPLETTFQYGNVEWPAYDWLTEYNSAWGGIKTTATVDRTHGTNGAALDLLTANNILEDLQGKPWYFQSISGVDQLWKAISRVKEGNMPVEITVGCIDSIEQPILKLAQHYRGAIYDGDRLCYNLPDNLRTFSVTITLFEVRDLLNSQNRLNQADLSSNSQPPTYLENGLHQVRFHLHRCEFDFSDTLGAGGSEFKAYTEEKPFTTSFKIKAGWVTEEATSTNIDDYYSLSIFSGLNDAIVGKANRFVQSALGFPERILGNVSEQIQTALIKPVLGNVYNNVNEVGNANSLFRRSPVGPKTTEQVGDTSGGYGGTFTKPPVKNLGKAY